MSTFPRSQMSGWNKIGFHVVCSAALFFSALPTARAQDEVTETEQSITAVSPCDRVSCSGHGNCIVVDTRPTCACDEGYMPDHTNGLSCLPVQQATEVDTSTEDALTEDPMSLDGPYIRGLELTLGGYNTTADKKRYSNLLLEGRFEGSFAQYLKRKFGGDQYTGRILVIVGVLLNIATVPLYVMYYKKGSVGFLAPAVGIEVLGTVLLITGAVKATVARKRIEKINYFVKHTKPKVSWGPPMGVGLERF